MILPVLLELNPYLFRHFLIICRAMCIFATETRARLCRSTRILANPVRGTALSQARPPAASWPCGLPSLSQEGPTKRERPAQHPSPNQSPSPCARCAPGHGSARQPAGTAGEGIGSLRLRLRSSMPEDRGNAATTLSCPIRRRHPSRLILLPRVGSRLVTA